MASAVTSQVEQSRRPTLTLLALLLLLLGLAAFFVVPFHVPVAAVYAESYYFGFNNRAADVILLGELAMLALFCHRGLIRLTPALAEIEARDEEGRPSPVVLWVALAVYTAASVLLYLLTRTGNGFTESLYFLDRIGLLAQGKQPYRDFEFVYGPLQILGPFWLARLLRLSLTNGYYLFWLASSLSGITMVWQSIRWLDLPAAGKRAAFLVLSIDLFGTLYTTGLNYNPLRYAAPIFLLLLLDRLDRRALARVSRRNDLAIAVAAAASAAFLCAISPEEGIVYSIAVAIFLPCRRLFLRRPFGWLAGALTLMLLGVLLGFADAGVFATMRSMGEGAFNLPILPGPQILILLCALGTGLAWLMQRGAERRLRSGPALLLLYVVGVLPAALGRCDWLHVMGYGMGAVLCAILLFWPAPAFRYAFLALILVPYSWLLVGGTLGTAVGIIKVQLYRIEARGEPVSGPGARLVALSRRQLTRSVGPELAEHKMERIRAVARLGSFDPHVLFPGASPTIYVPFPYSPQRLGSVQSASIAEGYFQGVLNVMTSVQAEQKIEEMRAHPERDLLLSPDGLIQCEPLRGDPQELRAMFLLPVVPRPRHEFNLIGPVCRYISTHYEPISPPRPETGDYGLWRFRAPRRAAPGTE